jgi:hypothetical protein
MTARWSGVDPRTVRRQRLSCPRIGLHGQRLRWWMASRLSFASSADAQPQRACSLRLSGSLQR